ncbi:META domain-containing protein [Nocardioides sp. zg-1230]|uniref:META domain-containing protein n=1 Tax=Nocardioides sp. zg-1230 TaxID=2736601 RepID=UPI001557F8CE|nr:META domain-containing protein [Nocardioides sp. zg-1230]NPC44465.1 META domain-containing protein [Nocardioides sp. zg-1230]
MGTPSSRRGQLRGTRPPVRAVVTLVAVVLLAACGSDGDGEAAGESGGSGGSGREPLRSDMALLEAASFVSTSVEGRDLLPGTEVWLSFDEETLAVSGGCNTSFGAFTLDDGTLGWESDPASTMIACSEEEAEQDAWVADLLTTGVAVTTDGADLHLASGDVSLVLEREPPVALESLLGRTWSVVGTLTDGTTSRLPSRVRTPRLVVGDDGLARLDTGCNTGRTRVQVDRVSVSFAPPTVTRVGCREPDRTIERIVLSVVDGRSDYLTYNGWVLLVVKDGNGLVFEVR